MNGETTGRSTCPTCGKEIVEREKSALELWEKFLGADPGEEKDWLRKTTGSLLKLANYLIILAAVIVMLGVGGLFTYIMFWVLQRFFFWWLSVLCVLLAVRLLQGWMEKLKRDSEHP